MAHRKATLELTVDDILRRTSLVPEETQALVRHNTATRRYWRPLNLDGVFIKYTTGYGKGISIYHDKSASATDATVAIASDTLTLIVTGGSNAGTYAIDLTHASYNTLGELVTYITHAQGKGFVAKISPYASASDTSSNLADLTTVDVFGAGNERTLMLGSEDGLLHLMERNPSGFIVVKSDEAGSIYAGSTAWTKAQVYLMSEAYGATVTVMIY